MRFLLALAACAMLAACASPPAANTEPVEQEATKAWRVQLHVDGEYLHYGRFDPTRLEWMQNATFESPRVISDAVASTVTGYAPYEFTGSHVDVSGNGAVIELKADEAAAVVQVQVRGIPWFSWLLSDFSEEDAWLLRDIHHSPSHLDPGAWNPARLIAATNALWHAGEAKAVSLLKSYRELQERKFEGAEVPYRAGFDGRIYALAMTLFSGDLLGISPLGTSRSPLARAHGAICTIDDIPFVTHLVQGGASLPETGLMFLERIQREGKWREGPMTPTGSPFAAWRELEKQHWHAAGNELNMWQSRHIESYGNQLMRCFGEVREGAYDDGAHHDDWNVWDDTADAFEALYASREVYWKGWRFRVK